ncbi:MAG: hypothetical protein ACRDP1_09480 [Nocardioidaceae bacterium]
MSTSTAPPASPALPASQSRVTQSPTTARPVGHPVRRRLTIAGASLAGAATVAVGTLLVWLSTFQGLLSARGIDAQHGQRLMAGAVLTALIAAAYAVTGRALLRWALGLAGFALTGFAAYWLIQLYSVAGGSGSMYFVSKGPGLYVCTAGGFVVLATLLLPSPDARVEPVPSGAVADGRLLDRPMLRAVGSWLRYPAAILALVAATAHVPVTPAHLKEAPYIGVLFIVLTVACILLATALLLRDAPVVWLLLAVTCGLAVLAYVYSRVFGLPMMADDIGHWLEPLGIVSIVTEALATIVAVTALRHRHNR